MPRTLELRGRLLLPTPADVARAAESRASRGESPPALAVMSDPAPGAVEAERTSAVDRPASEPRSATLRPEAVELSEERSAEGGGAAASRPPRLDTSVVDRSRAYDRDRPTPRRTDDHGAALRGELGELWNVVPPPLRGEAGAMAAVALASLSLASDTDDGPLPWIPRPPPPAATLPPTDDALRGYP